MSTRIYGPRGISDETVRAKTGKGWAEWDTEAAKELAVEANEVDTMPRA